MNQTSSIFLSNQAQTNPPRLLPQEFQTSSMVTNAETVDAVHQATIHVSLPKYKLELFQ